LRKFASFKDPLWLLTASRCTDGCECRPGRPVFAAGLE
jgi:hypothetical protein